mgnify:FL=1
MTHLHAVTKRKPAPRLVPCPACGGGHVARDVDVTQRDGRVTPGIAIVRVDCTTCNSTGLVRAGLARACCCSGPVADRCDGCRNARRGGSEIHHCSVATEEELAYETALALADAPGRAPTSDAARALDVSKGPRA